jgi:hypothetical protein
LSWAKHKGRQGIVELLRKHGANNHDEAVSFEPVPLANQKRTEPHTDAPKMVMNVGVVGLQEPRISVTLYTSKTYLLSAAQTPTQRSDRS